MKQKSNIQYRAEKEYKNSREKFSYLLREVISNAVHAVLIRESKESNFTPNVSLNIIDEDDKCKIVVKDNGEGFTKINSECFEELDRKNPEKEHRNFHPLGQGRLAIVYFSDSATYETVYKDEDGNYKKRIIPYPSDESELFAFDLFQSSISDELDTYTLLKLDLKQQNTLNRAKTFFKKYADLESLKNWFIETFFPFIVSDEKINITLCYNGEKTTINKDSLEEKTEKISFTIVSQDEKEEKFDLWLIKSDTKLRGENSVDCFARNLKAELVGQKITYSLESKSGYRFYLTSPLFDENVDTKGEKIEIRDDDVKKINDMVNEVLDSRFKKEIQENLTSTMKNLVNFEKKYPSLDTFVDKGNLTSGKIVASESDILKNAIERKSQIEKKFWAQDNVAEESNENDEPFEESEDCHKLLNSSLHIYVKHRERVLNELHRLIQKYDEEGNGKPELESKVHELFFKRGNTLAKSDNINHLHNLWILDDKFTIFSNDFKAQSTKNGQSLSDIYIWADDPERTKQILILELKSTTKAHNAGKSNEGMVAQVKRYARDFYKNPKDSLNWDVDTKSVQYMAIILACKADIKKELTSDSVSGDFEGIPFLKNSYYKDEKFPISDNPKDKIPIRIELYSFEDIYELASSRNEVFFKLLKKEYEVTNDESV